MSSTHMPRHRRLIGKVILLLTILVASFARDRVLPADAAAPSSFEYRIKAAFLYQFIKFIEWPSPAFLTTGDTVCIGVVGGGPMAGALQTIEGKEAKGRRVVVRRFKEPEDLEFCHVLFISSGLEGRVANILDRLKGATTLTVSDVDGFARHGGMISLITVEETVQFEINMDAAEKVNLQFSSQLLRQARIVHTER